MAWKNLLAPSSPRYTQLGFHETASKYPPRRIMWAAGLTVAAVFLIGTASWHARRSTYVHDPAFDQIHLNGEDWRFDHERDGLNFGLSDAQCNAAFPDLYQELDRARLFFGDKKIQEKDIHLSTPEELEHFGGRTRSEMHVLVHNGELFVIAEARGEPDRTRGLAALASLYRAITAFPNPRSLPNIEFVLDLHDNSEPGLPEKVRWTWARRDTNPWMWLVPDFDGWAYPDDAVGSYVQFREDVKEIEKPFEEKAPMLAWRGSLGVNHGLRQHLLEASENKSWSDVKAIDWRTRENVLAMQDFCKYQYVAHTEGNTWSGRLRYLHNCNSVPVIHDLDWIAHYYPLLQADGPHQNYVKVKRDWSDLEEKMDHLVSHPAEAKRIAAESALTFRDRYLTPAAEACYWRKMMSAWASIQDFEPRLYDEEVIDGKVVHRLRRGQTWERFAFQQKGSYEHGFFEPGKDDKMDDKKDHKNTTALIPVASSPGSSYEDVDFEKVS